jgi:hypothetical protein
MRKTALLLGAISFASVAPNAMAATPLGGLDLYRYCGVYAALERGVSAYPLELFTDTPSSGDGFFEGQNIKQTWMCQFKGSSTFETLRFTQDVLDKVCRMDYNTSNGPSSQPANRNYLAVACNSTGGRNDWKCFQP